MKQVTITVDAVSLPIIQSALALISNTASVTLANIQEQVNMQLITETRSQPPVDNAHVAPGCEQFNPLPTTDNEESLI